MKNSVIIIGFLMLISGLSAQELKIETRMLNSNVVKTNLVEGGLRFPKLTTGNSTIDSLLNNDLVHRITNGDYPNLNNDSILVKWANDGIVYMNYETTYNQNGIVSFTISFEGCGAYCTGATQYFNYNYHSGKYVNFADLVDTTMGFTKQILGDTHTQFSHQIIELKKKLKEEPSGFDNETYNWALTHYKECENEFNFNSFALYPTHLSIQCDCYMPHVIQNLAPEITLNYPYQTIKQYLKIKL